ncbi:hypothetical protein LINPERPRIM_LOCUS38530 [Linum perenne]
MSRTYEAWSQRDEQFLFDILLAEHDAGHIQVGTLHDCGYTYIEKHLKALVPNTKHTGDTIRTKFRQFKGKFHAQLDLMNASGMGWNLDKSYCECEPKIFVGWVKVCVLIYLSTFLSINVDTNSNLSIQTADCRATNLLLV